MATVGLIYAPRKKISSHEYTCTVFVKSVYFYCIYLNDKKEKNNNPYLFSLKLLLK